MATAEEPIPQSEPVAVPSATESSKDEKPPEKPTKKTATSKATKPKNPAAPRKPVSSSHPSYFEMIQDAIVTLKDKTGSSQYAITKFNEEKQKNLPPNFKKILLVQLRKLVASGKLVKVKASYKLPTGPSSLAKKKPAPAGKTSKPKKVTISKSKPAAKPKPVSKAKPAADPVKPKAAPKRKEPEKEKIEKQPAGKVAKVSASGTPGKRKAAVAGTKKTVVKKAPVKSVKPKSVKSPAKKATVKRGKK